MQNGPGDLASQLSRLSPEFHFGNADVGVWERGLRWKPFVTTLNPRAVRDLPPGPEGRSQGTVLSAASLRVTEHSPGLHFRAVVLTGPPLPASDARTCGMETGREGSPHFQGPHFQARISTMAWGDAGAAPIPIPCATS